MKQCDKTLYKVEYDVDGDLPSCVIERISYYIGGDFYKVGLNFNLSQYDLNNINSDKETAQDKALAVIDLLIKKNGMPKWREFKEKLKLFECKDIVDKIDDEFCWKIRNDVDGDLPSGVIERISYLIGDDFYDVGLKFHLPIHDLNKIESDNQTVHRKAISVFNLLTTQLNGKLNWREFREKLISFEHKYIVNSIEKEFSWNIVFSNDFSEVSTSVIKISIKKIIPIESGCIIKFHGNENIGMNNVECQFNFKHKTWKAISNSKYGGSMYYVTKKDRKSLYVKLEKVPYEKLDFKFSFENLLPVYVPITFKDYWQNVFEYKLLRIAVPWLININEVSETLKKLFSKYSHPDLKKYDNGTIYFNKFYTENNNIIHDPPYLTDPEKNSITSKLYKLFSSEHYHVSAILSNYDLHGHATSTCNKHDKQCLRYSSDENRISIFVFELHLILFIRIAASLDDLRNESDNSLTDSELFINVHTNLIENKDLNIIGVVALKDNLDTGFDNEQSFFKLNEKFILSHNIYMDERKLNDWWSFCIVKYCYNHQYKDFAQMLEYENLFKYLIGSTLKYIELPNPSLDTQKQISSLVLNSEETNALTDKEQKKIFVSNYGTRNVSIGKEIIKRCMASSSTVYLYNVFCNEYSLSQFHIERFVEKKLKELAEYTKKTTDIEIYFFTLNELFKNMEKENLSKKEKKKNLSDLLRHCINKYTSSDAKVYFVFYELSISYLTDFNDSFLSDLKKDNLFVFLLACTNLIMDRKSNLKETLCQRIKCMKIIPLNIVMGVTKSIKSLLDFTYESYQICKLNKINDSKTYYAEKRDKLEIKGFEIIEDNTLYPCQKCNNNIISRNMGHAIEGEKPMLILSRFEGKNSALILSIVLEKLCFNKKSKTAVVCSSINELNLLERAINMIRFYSAVIYAPHLNKKIPSLEEKKKISKKIKNSLNILVTDNKGFLQAKSESVIVIVRPEDTSIKQFVKNIEKSNTRLIVLALVYQNISYDYLYTNGTIGSILNTWSKKVVQKIQVQERNDCGLSCLENDVFYVNLQCKDVSNHGNQVNMEHQSFLTKSSSYPKVAEQIDLSRLTLLQKELGEGSFETTKKTYLKENSFKAHDNNILRSTTESKLTIDDLREKVEHIVSSKESNNFKVKQIKQLQHKHYKPLIQQFAFKQSEEGLRHLITVLKELGYLFIKLGELSRELKYYTKAAVFYQYVINILDKRLNEELINTKNEINKYLDIYQQLTHIQQLIFLAIGGNLKTIPNVKKEMKINKDILIAMQEKFYQNMQLVEYYRQQATTDNLEVKKTFWELYLSTVRALCEDIACEMKFFLSKLYCDSEQQMSLAPPCKYSVIGLRSMTLKQMTPYSDLEYAILTENEDYKQNNDIKIQAYFENLTYLVQFKLINLGTSIILKDKYGLDMDHLVHRAVNFDLGGKTPLGRIGNYKPYELIKTVECMMLYVRNEGGKTSVTDKNLPYLLENVCYVHGDEDLVKIYQLKVTEFLHSINIKDPQQRLNYEIRAIKLLQESTVEFDYFQKRILNYKTLFKDNLHPNLYEIEAEGIFNVKQEIYQLFDCMIYNLGLFYGIEGDSNWDTVDKLQDYGVITMQAASNIKNAIAFATIIRLKTASRRKTQRNEMFTRSVKMESEIKDLTKQIFHLTDAELGEQGELFKYFYTAIPLFEKLKDLCKQHNDLYYTNKQVFFQKINFYKDDYASKGLIYYRLAQYNEAQSNLEKALEDPKNRHNLQVRQILGKIYYSFGKDTLAIKHFQHSLEIEKCIYGEEPHLFVAISLNNLALCYSEREYNATIHVLKKSLRMFKLLYKDIPNSYFSCALLNLGITYFNTGQYDKAFKYYKKSLDMQKCMCIEKENPYVVGNLGLVYQYKAQYDQAIKYYEEILDTQKHIKKEEAHLNAAKYLNSLGLAFKNNGQYDDAIKYYKKILEMENISLYKTISFHSFGNVKYKKQYDQMNNYFEYCLKMRNLIYTNYSYHGVYLYLINISEVYRAKEQYRQAINYYQDGVKMEKQIYEKELSFNYIVASLNNLGAAFQAKGQYDLAIEYYEKSLYINKIIGKTHPDIAVSLNNLGKVYHAKMQYDQSINYYQASLMFLKLIYQNQHHLDVAGSLNNLGNICAAEKKFNQAINYYQKSLKMKKLIYKDEAHLDVVDSLNSLGNAYKGKRKYYQMIKYRKQSLEMTKRLCKQEHHLDVAASMNNLGLAYAYARQYDEAIKFFKESFKMEEQIFKKEFNFNVAGSSQSLGSSFDAKRLHYQALNYCEDNQKMKKLISKAIKYHKRTIDLEKCICYEENNPKYTGSLGSIEDIYKEKEKYEKAIEYLKKSLFIYKNLYKDKIHKEFPLFYNQGNYCNNKKQHEQAINYHEDSLKIRKQIYRDVSRRIILASLVNAGELYRAKDLYDPVSRRSEEYQNNLRKINKVIHENEVCKKEPESHSVFSEALQPKRQFNQVNKYYKTCLKNVSRLLHETDDVLCNNLARYRYENHCGQVIIKCKNNSKEKILGIKKRLCEVKPFNVFDSSHSIENSIDAKIKYLESMNKKKLIHKDGTHSDVADFLNSRSRAHDAQRSYNQALEISEEDLKMTKLMYQDDPRLVHADNLHNLGNVFQNKGQYDQTIKYFTKSLDMKKRVYNKEPSMNVVSSLHYLGKAYEAQGQYDQAINNFSNSLNLTKLIYHDQPNLYVVYSLNSLGNTYAAKGQYDLAIYYYLEVLKMKKRIYKDEPLVDVIDTLNCLGNAYKAKGHYYMLIKCRVEILEMTKRIYMEQNHPNVAASLNNLGLAFTYTGQYDQAIKYFEDSLVIKKQISKEKPNSNVSGSLHNLGKAYDALGQFDLAIKYFQESLMIKKLIYKDEPHLDVSDSLNSLSRAYDAKGQHNQALKYSEEGLKMNKLMYRDKPHLAVADSLHNLGNAHQNKGQYDHAIKYFTESLEIEKQIFKEEPNLKVAISLHFLGKAYDAKEQYDLALDNYHKSLEIKKLIYKDEPHSDIVDSFNSLSRAYDNKGQHNKALEYSEESLKMNKLMYNDKPHLAVAASLHNLGNAYQTKGQIDKAIIYYQQSLEMNRLIYQDQPHQNIATSLDNLGNAYFYREQYDKAIQYYSQSLNMKKVIFQGESHADVASSLNNLGTVCRANGQYGQAIKYNSHALKVISDFQGHPYADSIMSNLIKTAVLFAEKYSLSLQETVNKIVSFAIQGLDFTDSELHYVLAVLNDDNNTSKPQETERIELYKLALIFLPKEKLEVKLALCNKLAELTGKDNESVELWLTGAERNMSNLQELITFMNTVLRHSLTSTNKDNIDSVDTAPLL